jgi:hypothetical protein
MPSVAVERVPVRAFGLGLLGFDHLQIVFRSDGPGGSIGQEAWFVIEGLREPAGTGATVLAVEGWHGGTTLSEANGGLTGGALEERIGTPVMRDPRLVAEGAAAVDAWAAMVAFAADIESQKFPYIAAALPGSPLPAINSSSLVASLLHHAGIAVEAALPPGTRLSPGISTLLGTSGADTLSAGGGFDTVLGGAGDDTLGGSHAPARTDKLYGGAGDDVFHWSGGFNIVHGGQPGMARAADGLDAMNYSGAGVLSLDAPPHGRMGTAPDFIVTHAGGEDHLFSIEEIIWDARSDRLIIGPGVAVAPADPSRQTSIMPLPGEGAVVRVRILALPLEDGGAVGDSGETRNAGGPAPLSLLEAGDDAAFPLGEIDSDIGDPSCGVQPNLWG